MSTLGYGRNAYSVVMRVSGGNRGMSAGNEMTMGEYSVHKEPQGASVILKPLTTGNAGYAKLRLDRQQAQQLIADLQEALK